MMSEWCVLTNEQGAPIGCARRTVCHGNTALLHAVVHVFVIDEDGRIFLQKRAMNKDIQPGKWDTSVGGHVDPGETYDTAAWREMQEELGIQPEELTKAYNYIWFSEVESEFVTTYSAQYSGTCRIDPSEIDEGRWWNREEIRNTLKAGTFTPNFEHEFRLFEAHCREEGT